MPNYYRRFASCWSYAMLQLNCIRKNSSSTIFHVSTEKKHSSLSCFLVCVLVYNRIIFNSTGRAHRQSTIFKIDSRDTPLLSPLVSASKVHGSSGSSFWRFFGLDRKFGHGRELWTKCLFIFLELFPSARIS